MSESSQKKILIIGDIMLDHYIYGTCNRISPEAPVQVVEVAKETYSLGGAGNVFKNVISLGFNAEIFSIVGDDQGADTVLSELSSYMPDTGTIIRDNSRLTTVKSRVLASNYQLIRLDREITTPIGEDNEQQLLNALKKNIANYNVVLISDYNKGVLTSKLLSGIINLCKMNQIKTIVDPKGLDFSKYHGAYLIKPNKKEASIATGIAITDHYSTEQACIKIQKISGCENVIITMSEDGMAFYSNNTLSIIPTKALDILDVTGAGDTVLAALGVAIASGKNLSDACDFANHAAAVVINKIGSATVSMEEIDNLLT